VNKFCRWQKISAIVASTSCPPSGRCQGDEYILISPSMIRVTNKVTNMG
jgi:hypothetical protein